MIAGCGHFSSSKEFPYPIFATNLNLVYEKIIGKLVTAFVDD